MVVDVYLVRRRNGEAKELTVPLDNESFGLSRSKMKQRILYKLNSAVTENPWIAAKFLKRTAL